MKLTRRKLRRLIKESILNEMPFIKPGGKMKIDDEGYGKLSDLALSPGKANQEMADFLARDFGYPEDRSYVDDLKTYDAAGRATFDTVYVKPPGQTEAEVVSVGIPYELVEELVRRYKKVVELESQGTNIYDQGRSAHTFREAGMDIFQHIHDHLDDKYGRNSYDIYSYGADGAYGYLSDEYGKAMEKVGEHL